MSLSVGSAKLNRALKNLLVHWEGTKDVWNDHVRREFEEKHVQELESQVRATMGGMSRLAQVVQNVRQDCT